jgi:hypothetical protein
MGLQILCQLCRVEEQECELLWAFPKSGGYCLVLSAAEVIGRSKQPNAYPSSFLLHLKEAIGLVRRTD